MFAERYRGIYSPGQHTVQGVRTSVCTAWSTVHYQCMKVHQDCTCTREFAPATECTYSRECMRNVMNMRTPGGKVHVKHAAWAQFMQCADD